MIENLEQFHEALTTLKASIAKETGIFVAKAPVKKKTGELASNWFSEFYPLLTPITIIPSKTLAIYGEWFAKLLKLSKTRNRKNSYLEALGAVTKTFHDDLVIPIQIQPKLGKEATELTKLFENLTDPGEDEYMKEAIGCATHDYKRGAAVLGWSAAIDRIHRVIEKIGFDKFNTTSVAMKAATAGRFKRFEKVARITSISELREYHDSDIIWVLEGMGLIDNNQNTRLKSSFDLRNHCSHPGEAPVTMYNLLSFFSDLDEIIFKNPKFAI